ncbi:MAG: hypothetical protein A2V86_10090 [Deltaproteobacteria bacterium RBG_16_49_23]|nr:MAG: hypothetical protein A2V86_10090 [Deltaproteobacteria bacterium RBG_16_49_23]
MKRKLLFIFLSIFVLSGCASVTIHDDLKLPPGRIEGNQFTGIRYPFKVSIPPHWKMVTEFPGFLKDLGYDEPGASDNEVTELYIFNPTTQSTIQIDFTPASRKVKFSQEKIERFATAATGSFKEELLKDYGKDIQADIGPTEPIVLKGVPFAAKKYAIYTLKGVKREQGWIYGFTEPYQLFIFYVILEREGSMDREDLKKVLDSFEVLTKK